MANQNSGGGNAFFINLFLFIAIIMFMSKSRKEISAMKETHDEKYYNQISCQSQALVWTLISFLDYYGYQLFLLILICMDDHSQKDKNRRFNFALFLTFFFIPFMIGWNFYGSFMLKADYFE